MKKITLILCLLLISCTLFAGVSQSVSLGAGWDWFHLQFREDEETSTYKTNGFDISLSGMTVLDNAEHVVIYENIDYAFSNKFGLDGTTDDVDKCRQLGLTLGAGYTSAIKNTQLSYAVGVGFGWNRITVTEGEMTLSFSEWTSSAFGNLRYDIKDGWFADLTIIDSISFHAKASISVSPEPVNYRVFFNNPVVKVGAGYRFDF